MITDRLNESEVCFAVETFTRGAIEDTWAVEWCSATLCEDVEDLKRINAGFNQLDGTALAQNRKDSIWGLLQPFIDDGTISIPLEQDAAFAACIRCLKTLYDVQQETS